MCTLTYIPFKQGYIFTHNRDERQDRPSSNKLLSKPSKSGLLYYPKDLEANGSWIAHAENNTSACLLNGGSIDYQRKASYRKSRGLVVLESFDYDTPESFYHNYDFNNIEPFTLVIRTAEKLFCIIHNEHNTELIKPEVDRINIWSSTKLYTPEVRRKREIWFQNWLDKKPELSPEKIRNFHMSAGEGDSENDLIMSRWGILKTVSLTQITSTNSYHLLHYNDFISQNEDVLHLRPAYDGKG